MDWHTGYIWDHHALDDEDCVGVNNIHVRIVSDGKLSKVGKLPVNNVIKANMEAEDLNALSPTIHFFLHKKQWNLDR